MKQKGTKKCQLFIGATIQPIQNCDFLANSDDYTLFLSKRNLIVMNLEKQTLKSCVIQNQQIFSATFHPVLQIFLINSTKNLIILNKEGQIINRLKIPELLQAKSLIFLKTQQECQEVETERKDQLLFITEQYMYRVGLIIHFQRSLLKTKGENVMKYVNIQLKQKPYIIHYQWTANYVYLSKIDLLICWNQSETYIFETPKKVTQKINLLYIFDKIIRRNKVSQADNKVNCFQASLKHRLLIAAFQLGSIKLYKLDETKKYIYQLRGHQKQCTGILIPKVDSDLLYSCSLDNSIRVWDLIDFNQVYYLRFDIVCSRVTILNQKLIFGKSGDNRKSFFIKINIQLLKPFLSQSKVGTLIDLYSDGEWGVALYSNNFIQAFLLGDYNNQTRQFNQKMEFPLNYGFLRSTIKIREQKFVVCLQKGFSVIKLNKKENQTENFELKKLVYNHSLNIKPKQNEEKGKLIQVIHEKLLDTFFFSILEDWKNIPSAIKVTAVSFVINVKLPKWDGTIKSKQPLVTSDFVILGTERGDIFFVDIKQKTHFYTRANFHANSIISIDQIKFSNSKNLFFISMSDTKELAIWQISEQNSPKIHIKLNYTKDILKMKTNQNYIAFGCKSGQFNILELRLQNEQIKLYESSTSKQDGHLKSIVSIDYIQYKNNKLWLTAGEDHIVKIWKGIQKQLIIQIRMFSSIHCAIFAKRNIDLLLCHGDNNQISVLDSNHISQLAQAKNSLQNNKQQNNDVKLNNISFRQFLCISFESHSPNSPRKKQRLFMLQRKSMKRVQFDDALSRSMQKITDTLPQPMTERKLSIKREKNAKQMENFNQIISRNSLILPRINSKFSNYKKPGRKYEQQEVNFGGSSILQRMDASRLKSYSHAGRMIL